jgi:hypothetical protein
MKISIFQAGFGKGDAEPKPVGVEAIQTSVSVAEVATSHVFPSTDSLVTSAQKIRVSLVQ